MKKYLFFALFLFAITYSNAQELPLKTQPLLWLKADATGSNPTFWQNYADSAYNASMISQTIMPDTVDFNFQRAFNINSSSTPFIVSDFYPAIRDKYTVFTVYQIADTASEYGLWQMQLDSNTDVKLSSTKTKNIRSYIKVQPKRKPQSNNKFLKPIMEQDYD